MSYLKRSLFNLDHLILSNFIFNLCQADFYLEHLNLHKNTCRINSLFPLLSCSLVHINDILLGVRERGRESSRGKGERGEGGAHRHHEVAAMMRGAIHWHPTSTCFWIFHHPATAASARVGATWGSNAAGQSGGGTTAAACMCARAWDERAHGVAGNSPTRIDLSVMLAG